MKGGGTLALLVGFAALAAIVLVVTKPARETPLDPAATTERAPQGVVEEMLGFSFLEPPVLETVPSDLLIDEVAAFLDERFGPGGLMRRARALELIGFTDFAQRSLRDEMIAWQAAGVRGWFDERSGRILLAEDFDEQVIHDRVALFGLLARLLVHQHTPPAIGKLPDDAWIAQQALHRAIAQSVEAQGRAENRTAFEIPTAAQTERESVLLALPIYLHQIANLPHAKGEARIYLETRLRTGARALGELVDDPPRNTLELLGGDPATVKVPRLPSVPPNSQVLLEETLGAFPVQALIEWIVDYEQAQALAPLWRGDRYRLFATTAGDHLLWLSRWETPEAAARVAEILRSREPANPSRHVASKADGPLTVFVNAANAAMVQEVMAEFPER